MNRATTIRRTRRHPCAAGHSNAPPKDLAPCPCGCGDQLLPSMECAALREIRGARFDIGDGVRVAATREQRRVTSGPLKVAGGFEVETLPLLPNKGEIVRFNIEDLHFMRAASRGAK